MRTFSKEAIATLLVSALLGVAVGCSKHTNDETIAQDVQKFFVSYAGSRFER